MDTYLRKISELCEKGIQHKVFPGAVIHLSREGKQLLFESFGDAELTPAKRVLDKDMIFDLASLTKVMATLPAIVRSVQLAKLDLEMPVSHYISQWNDTARGSMRTHVTVRHLLTHSSGLPAWRPLYLGANSRDEYLRLICEEPLDNPPGTKVVYSDLGFMLLGFLLERIWQKPLDQLCDELVFRPLGLEQTGYNPKVPGERIVATEVGNQFEMKMCHDFADQCALRENQFQGLIITGEDIRDLPWRTGTICGEVNDGNAYYGLQGVSGHAGLFSTALDVARYLTMWADEGLIDGKQFLDKQLVRMTVKNHTPALNIARAYGFEAAPAANSDQWNASCSAGPAARAGAFGHTGFTGTSMWFDPHSKTKVVVLTNRIHPQVGEGMQEWRRELHAAAFS